MSLKFEPVYPSPFDIDIRSGKMKFFLGDRWIEIGPVHTFAVSKGIMQIVGPDINQFIDSREYLNDGTYDWAIWGPRLN